MRASTNALANRRSSPRTANARLNSSTSNAMSGTATSATRVRNDSGLITSAGHPPGMATMAHESSRRSFSLTLNSYSNARTWSPCHVPHTTLSSLPYERWLHRMSANGPSSRSNGSRAENRSRRRRASASNAFRRGGTRRSPTARIAPMNSPPASSSRASRHCPPAIRTSKPIANTPARTFSPVE